MVALSLRIDSHATHARTHLPAVLASTPFGFLELLVPCKARWVWAGAVAIYMFRPRDHCRSPRRKLSCDGFSFLRGIQEPLGSWVPFFIFGGV
jgi:hypothetical protein